MVFADVVPHTRADRTNRTVVGPVRLVGAVAGGCVLFATTQSDASEFASLGILIAWFCGGALGSKALTIWGQLCHPRSSSRIAPSWTTGFWGANLAVLSVCGLILNRNAWPPIYWAMSIAITLSYSAARVGCTINGCCWQKRRSPCLSFAMKVFGGPLTNLECRWHLVLATTGVFLGSANRFAIVGLFVFSLHAWSKLFADIHRVNRSSPIFWPVFHASVVQIAALGLYLIMR